MSLKSVMLLDHYKQPERKAVSEQFEIFYSVFWDVAQCSLAEIDQCFRGAYCLHQQGDDR
jgi:hypothetical protein